MSITQTALVFAGIPLAVIVVVFLLVYGTSARRSSKRYRPGRPFTFAPVWFLAAPERVPGEGTAARELTNAQQRTALPAGPLLSQAADAPPVPTAHGETGGASDSW